PVLRLPRRPAEVLDDQMAVVGEQVRPRGDEVPDGAVTGVDLDADPVADQERLVPGPGAEPVRHGRRRQRGKGRLGEERRRGRGDEPREDAAVEAAAARRSSCIGVHVISPSAVVDPPPLRETPVAGLVFPWNRTAAGGVSMSETMCGIAGYSLSSRSTVDRTLAAQSLLAAIAERGADAAGYAHRARDGRVVVRKQRSGASALLDRIELPGDTPEVLLHVRDYTKGDPRIDANNHPIRHGAVVGVHNGVVANDEQIMRSHGAEHAEPDMTVDSEAIFALVDRYGPNPAVLGELHGTMAAAWLDDRRPGVLWLARGIGRPLWIGTGRQETFFASTKPALELVERYLGLELRKREVAEGVVLELAGGRAGRLRR